MKKKNLICFLLVLLWFGGGVFAEPITVLNHSFEYDQDGELVLKWVNGLEGTPLYWAYESGCDNDTWEDPETDGYVCVAIGGPDELYQTLDQTIYPGDEYLLQYDVMHVWAEGGVYDGSYQGRLYYDDGGERVTFAYSEGLALRYQWTLNNDCLAIVPAGSPAMGHQLGVELAPIQGENSWMGFDNVRLELVSSLARAHDPEPADGEDMVTLDSLLRWKTGVSPSDFSLTNPSIANHLLYFSDSDPNLPPSTLAATIPAGDPPAEDADFDPVLLRDKTYYWRVDEQLDGGDVMRGFTWSFNTILSVPMFPEDGAPEDQEVFANETAVFTVEAINPNTLDSTNLLYAWHKEGSSTTLSTSDTLEVVNAQIANEGEYYCVVTIGGTSFSSESPRARLVIKRLISYWPFDGNMEDAVGDNDGEGSTTFDYSAGIVDGGQAIEFVGGSKDVVRVPTDAHGTYPSWSLSWWENSDPELSADDFESMLACGTDEDGWNIFDFTRYSVFRYAFGINVPYNQKIISGRYIFTPFDAYLYPRGEWRHMAVTYDAVTRSADWYINGERIGVLGSDLPLTFAGFEGEDIYVGNCKSADWPQPYAGLIDDLRFYNYHMEHIEVALEYTTVSGEEICVGLPIGDTSGDCEVGLDDLVIAISSWLDCNLWPSEACQ